MRDRNAIDPARLLRASQLAVMRLGPTQFRVRGQHEPYYDVDVQGDPPCYCMDSQMRGPNCKHALASRLANGDMVAIQMLGAILLRQQQVLEEYTRRTRRTRPLADAAHDPGTSARRDSRPRRPAADSSASIATPSARSPRAQEPAA